MGKTSLWRLWIVGAVLAGILAGSAWALLAGSPGALLGVALGYLAYELALAALLTGAALSGLRALARTPADARPPPTVSVLIAAHNERDFILGTLRSIREQGGLDCEVIVASDGSTDGMNALLVRELGLVPDGPERFRGPGPERLWLLALPKLGKGAALNRALALARGEVVVTLDADTVLGANALRELALPFRERAVEAAAGFVYVRNARANLLTRYQFTEYLKNFFWRIGLNRLGVNLQVSGAFGALRTSTLRAIGGFSENSLVEDYEVIYRLHDALRTAGRPYRLVAVPDAAAFTEVPERLGSFVAQRTRWFTGFLQTLWDYRLLVGSRRHGAIGLFMLPIKCVDATLPLWGPLSLACLLGAGALGHARESAWATAMFLGKWAFDAALYAGMVRWHARAYPGRQPVPARWSQYATSATESLGFNLLRQVAVLRAYVWMFRRTQRWEQPRWQTAALEAAAPVQHEAA
jgi:cellulose synthase/poly-beta-1,6-N-acetylglucosamine synthase-like glycosyltransferase